MGESINDRSDSLADCDRAADLYRIDVGNDENFRGVKIISVRRFCLDRDLSGRKGSYNGVVVALVELGKICAVFNRPNDSRFAESVNVGCSPEFVI